MRRVSGGAQQQGKGKGASGAGSQGQGAGASEAKAGTNGQQPTTAAATSAGTAQGKKAVFAPRGMIDGKTAVGSAGALIQGGDVVLVVSFSFHLPVSDMDSMEAFQTSNGLGQALAPGSLTSELLAGPQISMITRRSVRAADCDLQVASAKSTRSVDVTGCGSGRLGSL